ncbi:type II toxin-antitoxin system RelB/DinJ family antitoxin [Ruminococcus sp.]|uniref:type II toxin-antitoxin system RelB/DinJ family antitoxin n=1 Tax=Ruminococcus sp. TaxID=41978 RepID=UPI002E764FB3|nr:type II toxin-antitoxin system RelB/DinJ family antitoxin [Ruminococcus sp.]MEE1262479.1 type II toxin-antitoxin system RelB/DinJ family antitoxin [Ruminococcus sp.]
MANTSPVYARINTQLKENAEAVMDKLGISPSNAIQMLYSQIVLLQGMPFEIKMPERKPVDISSLSRAELDAELLNGIDSLRSGKALTEDEVEEELTELYGI